jgi:hypothetical protein
MRTNIVIDDQLMPDAMQASGARTSKVDHESQRLEGEAFISFAQRAMNLLGQRELDFRTRYADVTLASNSNPSFFARISKNPVD